MINTVLFSVLMAIIANAFSEEMVDMTHVFDDTTLHYPGVKAFKIENLINGTVGNATHWIQVEDYSSCTHLGTHMDAPSHFIKGGLNIDDIPLSEFFGPAAVVDISAKAELDPDVVVTVTDFIQWESTTRQNLNGTIVLIKSGWGLKWNNRTQFFGTPEEDPTKIHFPGMSAEASQWLVDNRKVKGIGTDTLSIDVGPSRDYPAHNILLGSGMFVLEGVANVERLPSFGATLSVIPMKIGKGSGAPVRIIATIPKSSNDTTNRNNDLKLIAGEL